MCSSGSLVVVSDRPKRRFAGMSALWQVVYMGILDLIFPKKCVGCGRVGNYVCQECELGMWEEEQICPICCRLSRYGLRHTYCKPAWAMEGLVCFWAYEGIARKLITKAKYNYYFDFLKYSSLLTTQYLLRPEFAVFVDFLKDNPIMIPVPLYKKRLVERGFNQAEIITNIISKQWKVGTGNLLLRVKDTGRQVGRTREERLKAMEGAFKFKMCNPSAGRAGLQFSIPEKVLLVDDVWTTGATMRECTKVLKMAGIKKVWGMVLVR